MTLNVPDTGSKRIIVVGGGFAGITLLKQLAKTGYQVVLVDRNNFHQFQPLLYQVASAAINPGDISFPFRRLYRGKKNIYFRMAEVERVDAEAKTIYTDRGCLSYDYLVLATGSSTNYFGMRNIEREAFPMKEVSEALAIRNRILLHIEKAVELPDNSEKEALLNIVIVGGGATGVELAGAFAEMKSNILNRDYPEYHKNDINIYLIEGADRLIGTMSKKTSAGTLRTLKNMGVKVILNNLVTDYCDRQAILKDGTSITTHNLIWTSGVTVRFPEGLDALTKGKGNRAVTDNFFRAQGADGIYVIGDASIQTVRDYPNGYPQLARVAMEQAAHLGKNFRRMEKGKQARGFEYVEYPVMATVGRNHAYAEFRKFRMGGFFGYMAWAFVHLFLILGVKNKINIFFGWMWNYLTYDLPTRVVILPRKIMDSDPSSKSRSGRQGQLPASANLKTIPARAVQPRTNTAKPGTTGNRAARNYTPRNTRPANRSAGTVNPGTADKKNETPANSANINGNATGTTVKKDNSKGKTGTSGSAQDTNSRQEKRVSTARKRNVPAKKKVKEPAL